MGRESKIQEETLSQIYHGLDCPHCVHQNLLLPEGKKGVRKTKITLRTVQMKCRDCGAEWSLSWAELREALFKSAMATGKKNKRYLEEVNKNFSEIVGGFVRTKKKSSKE
jgi:hypothetical protein